MVELKNEWKAIGESIIVLLSKEKPKAKKETNEFGLIGSGESKPEGTIEDKWIGEVINVGSEITEIKSGDIVKLIPAAIGSGVVALEQWEDDDNIYRTASIKPQDILAIKNK
jgi:hypothetical protein